jgi:predicted ATPase
MASGRDLPTGTVTFLFTDVEGSTKLLHELGAEGYAAVLTEHRRVIREACSRHGGVEVDTQGDAFFVAFPTAPGALKAARAITERLEAGPIRVRMGIHTGTPLLTDEGYVGADVHRAARIAASGHGGQVLVSTSTATLVDLELHDLGEHRFKDLAAPERVFQLGEDEFSSIKSLYRTNLPVPATPFLGREQELAEVVELLTREDVRLLTLSGPGGTGKTRLALQAVAEASDSYPDGVFWVALAPLRDPGLVLSSVAQVLEVSEQPGRELKEALARQLAGKRLVVLLDNLEHLLPEAAVAVSALRDMDGPLVLVTSRERLRIQGEQAYPVPPLAERDGIELFTARARAVEPSFTPTEAVTELCERLDELPLALELAAARTAVFAPDQLLERLSQRLDLLKAGPDSDPRQQTLRATIEWSHDLLTSDEQALFRRMSVFAGGCTYEASERVAGADPDTLQSLLDKSLLRRRDTDVGPRYWMLETIREYAVERLEGAADGNELRRKHSEFFRVLADEAALDHEGPDQAIWLARLEEEHDNLHVALTTLRGSGTSEDECRLALALSELWFAYGRVREARDVLGRLVAIREELPAPERALILRDYAWVLHWQGDWRAALPIAEEAVEVCREIGEPVLTARCENRLGVIALELGDRERARSLFEESLVILRESEDAYLQLAPLQNLGGLAWQRGDYSEAKRLLNEGRGIAAEFGPLWLGPFLTDLGITHTLDGDANAALELFREALPLYGAVAHLEVPYVLEGMAGAHAMCGQAERATELLAAADVLREAFGAVSDSWERKVRDFALAAVTPLDESALDDARVRWRSCDLEDAIAYALGDSADA